MDTRSAFAFILIAIGLGGLYAVATGRLQLVNGAITIGTPVVPAAATTSAAASTPGQIDSASSSSSSYGSPTTVSGTPSNTNALASILGGTFSGTTLSQIYDTSAGGTSLVSPIGGDGAAVNPYGTMVA